MNLVKCPFKYTIWNSDINNMQVQFVHREKKQFEAWEREKVSRKWKKFSERYDNFHLAERKYVIWCSGKFWRIRKIVINVYSSPSTAHQQTKYQNCDYFHPRHESTQLWWLYDYATSTISMRLAMCRGKAFKLLLFMCRIKIETTIKRF